MWKYPEQYDVIVVGGGHAGCEAALGAARMGARTLLLTMNLDTIAKMSCNPAVGGVAKGHMVREIDALGGEMGKVTDRTAIQTRMLNPSRGPAVWAPRAQSDRIAYQFEMKSRLERQENLHIKQGMVDGFSVEDGVVTGVATKEEILYCGSRVILCSGTFMRGTIHIGETNYSGGRAGDQPAVGISKALSELGFNLERLKTGTPARLNARSIDFSLCEEQPGEEGVRFSYDEPEERLPQVSCWITYTTEETHQIIRDNLHRSPMYAGAITGVGPRYCPSIEDKVVRFADKNRHQIFLEPEGLNNAEFYLNGISSSLPFDVQLEMLKSIPALRNAEVMRPAYAIEYDYVTSGQIDYTLQTRSIEGLYFAGQINGTTGYEEAAAQGLMAAINAVRSLRKEEPFILKRSEAYIGVMIDDIVSKGLTEPYRMFTSRAEHRLLLRQDNADLRLRRYGYELGLIDQERYDRLVLKEQTITEEVKRLDKVHKQVNGKGSTVGRLMSRPEMTYDSVMELYPEEVRDHGAETNRQIELTLKYAGYIERQKSEVRRLEEVERIRIPPELNFSSVKGLRKEAEECLTKFQPNNLGQASRLVGVSPADISVLMVALQR